MKAKFIIPLASLLIISMAGCDRGSSGQGSPGGGAGPSEPLLPPPPSPPPPPPPPPPPVACNSVQEDGARSAISAVGRELETRYFMSTEPQGVTLSVCEFDPNDSRIRARGRYAFVGRMNHDYFSFEASVSTDSVGGDAHYSSIVPDSTLQDMLRFKQGAQEFINAMVTASENQGNTQ